MAGLTELIGLVEKTAPLLATALGSPIAGIAVSLIGQAFGVSGNTESEVLRAIQADPEATIKLKTLEYTHQESLANLTNNEYATEVNDRENARNRQILLHDHVPTILALLVVIIYAGIQFMAIYAPHDVDDIISARVQDIFVMIISYYYGSSNGRGSKKIN